MDMGHTSKTLVDRRLVCVSYWCPQRVLNPMKDALTDIPGYGRLNLAMVPMIIEYRSAGKSRYYPSRPPALQM
jgi:hypothetical protein